MSVTFLWSPIAVKRLCLTVLCYWDRRRRGWVHGVVAPHIVTCQLYIPAVLPPEEAEPVAVDLSLGLKIDGPASQQSNPVRSTDYEVKRQVRSAERGLSYCLAGRRQNLEMSDSLTLEPDKITGCVGYFSGTNL